jgi:outer membrane immunogenic protein
MRCVQSALLAAIAVFSIPSLAWADDAAVKEKAATISSDWTGFYIAVVGGYGWGEGHFTGTGTGAGKNNSVSMPGGMVGGQFGYDYSLGNNFIAGAAADMSWTDLSGQTCVATFACNPSQDAFATGKMDWFSTVRARTGVIEGNALFYITGGLALTHLTGGLTHLTKPSDPTLTASHIHAGWTIGAGVDYKLLRHVSLAIEYLYVDFEKQHYDFSNSLPGAPIVLGADGNLTGNIARASLIYRFNGTNGTLD